MSVDTREHSEGLCVSVFGKNPLRTSYSTFCERLNGTQKEQIVMTCNLCALQLPFTGVKGRGEKGVPKAGGKGKHPVQHTDDPTAEHDFLGCMSR